MRFTIVTKAVNGFKKVLNRKKGGNSAGSTPTPKKRYFMKKYKAVGKAIKQKRQRFFGNVTTGFSKLAKRSGRLKKNMLLFKAASTATGFKLPSTFAGDRGISFVILIQQAIADKRRNSPNRNFNFQSVTGWELWEFVRKNRNSKDLTHIARRFAKCSEKQIRMLSKDWLELDVTMRSFAKMLSYFGDLNSPLHLAYLNLLNLTQRNAHLWLPAVFRDRITLDIHSFQIVSNNALRITYHVPIPLRPSKFYPDQANIIASDTQNFFNTNLVSFKIVIEISYDFTTGSFDKKRGKLITGFLHDQPLKDDDIKTMLNVSPNKFFWGGDKITAQLYINSVGKTGLKALPGPPLFRILNKAVDPVAQKIEANYPNGFIVTHYRRKDKNRNPIGPCKGKALDCHPSGDHGSPMFGGL